MLLARPDGAVELTRHDEDALIAVIGVPRDGRARAQAGPKQPQREPRGLEHHALDRPRCGRIRRRVALHKRVPAADFHLNQYAWPSSGLVKLGTRAGAELS